MNNRRSFIKKAGLFTALSTLSLTGLEAFAADKKEKGVKRAMRIAHLTDVHILDKPQPKEALRRILETLNTMNDKPDMIINTGDSVMDVSGMSKNNASILWKAFTDTMANNNKITVKSCIGNHDVWSAPKDQVKELETDPLYGKKMAIKALDLPANYYSFMHKGWKFIALDSIHYSSEQGGYTFGEEQQAWLKKELEATSPSTNVLIFSHVPIISATPLMYSVQRNPTKDIRFAGGDQHTDVKLIKDLFKQHKNVKVALSGHIHYIDTVDYLGVKYICGGAVSGSWWGGTLDDFPPAYSILDLYEDGTSSYQSIFYKWD